MRSKADQGLDRTPLLQVDQRHGETSCAELPHGPPQTGSPIFSRDPVEGIGHEGGAAAAAQQLQQPLLMTT